MIPVRDQVALTRACLDSLADARDGTFETIVVDDGSRDRTRDLLDALHDQTAVVTHRTSVGFAAACNAGAAHSSSEYIVFLNNDTLGVGDWLGTLVGYADAHPSAAVVGAKLLFLDNTVQHAGVAFGPALLPFHIYAGFPADHPAVARSRRFAAVTGACMLVRRQAFELAGGFDESFHNCYEDIDLCLRLRDHGLESHLCAQAVLYHFESATRDTVATSDAAGPLFLSRWRGRVVRDDLTYYADDGLLELAYHGLGDVEVTVAPELGHAVSGNGDGAVERLLGQRSRELAGLHNEHQKLWRELMRARPESVRVRSDGSRSTLFDEQTAAIEGQQLLTQIEQKLAPLRLSRSAVRPATVNVLISSIERQTYFAGTAAAVQLACRLCDDGHHARLVLLDEPPGAIDLPAGVECFDATDRWMPLGVSDDDVFVASSVWSAHVAHQAVAELGRRRFVFLIQEDETLFYPSGSYHALARQAYGFAHVALFSTEVLRDWFAAQRLGVFAAEAPPPQELVFRNAMTDPGLLNAAVVRSRAAQGLLFYARPGSTEARNLYEIGLLALRDAVSAGVFSGDWRFTGVGSARDELLALPDGRPLALHCRQEPARYRAMLRSHDVGLALMDSPHPSLVPIEMAAAGMPTVTSTFHNKDAASLAGISANLIACAPTVDAVAAGLALAVSRLADVDARLRGAEIDWPRHAGDAFTPALLTELLAQATR